MVDLWQLHYLQEQYPFAEAEITQKTEDSKIDSKVDS